MVEKKIPIGIEDFKEIIDRNCYFVDKTMMIRDLLDSGGKVSLFTRPRRFGKTLNMSMIRYFFERSDEDYAYLFKDLKIAGAGEKYWLQQGQYPVISITLKDIEASDFQTAFSMYKELIAREFKRHRALLASPKLFEGDKALFMRICNREGDYATYCSALKFLSECLHEVYGKKAIILIDEYDVPLQNAHFKGFYNEMVELIRSVLSSALKTNSSLEFAVLTGCLRISKESIFTGLNNLDVYSVTEPKFSDACGFTEAEVAEMAAYYGQIDKMPEIKRWYDGYVFGRTEIYNPWSVLKYLQQANNDAPMKANPYWSNTSSNSIIQELMMKGRTSMRRDLERLINGEILRKPLYSDVTYANMNVTEDTIWSFLLYTGYLKCVKQVREHESEFYFDAMIPNAEVRSIYKDTFLRWFRQIVREADKTVFFNAILHGNAQVFEEQMNTLLMRSISYHDGMESFYHGFLTGLLEFSDRYLVESNRENGTGRSDIIITDELAKEIAVVIEAKSMGTDDLNAECRDALQQIEDKKYASNLETKGYKKILKYGVGFSGKNCRVMLGK